MGENKKVALPEYYKQQVGKELNNQEVLWFYFPLLAWGNSQYFATPQDSLQNDIKCHFAENPVQGSK